MRLAAFLAWIGIALVAPAAQARSIMDRSHEIFFPRDMRKNTSVYQTFPSFWWNFVVIEGTAPEQLVPICEVLKSLGALRVECGQSLREFLPVLEAWAADLPLRIDRPSDETLLAALDESMAKASLPTGEPALLPLLRGDPLSSWRELRAHAEKRLPIHLERRLGFFFDAQTRRTIIPVQLGFDPTQTAHTVEFRDSMNQAAAGVKWIGIGPHFSTLRNEERVQADVANVSIFETLILLASALAVIAIRRWRLVLLIPIVLLATGIAVGVTILIFGSIHGLTLSFGTGIIGLALDYGLHASIHRESSRTWHTNLFGLLTTMGGLFVLLMSDIPLLQQLMVFSILGLGVGYVLYYFALTRFPEVFAVEPLAIETRTSRWRNAVTGVLLAGSLLGIALIRPNLDMRALDFQDAHARETQDWLFETLKLKVPLFTVNSEPDALARAHDESAWARSQGIALENIAEYLPSLSAQLAHQATWKSEGCAKLRSRLSEDQARFFEPFLQGPLCNFPDIASRPQPAYLKHLSSAQNRLTLWLPETPEQEARIRARFPGASSLRDVAMIFPTRLSREMKWMTPLAFAIASFLLFLYFRRVSWSLYALLPFFTSLGAISLAVFAFGYSVSFISVVALIMVFGFSFDYGIFVTELMTQPESQHSQHAVWTALSFAAISTIVGFIPLLAARHPVLAQLGQVLFFGAVGTYLGSRWGIPGAMKLFEKAPPPA